MPAVRLIAPAPPWHEDPLTHPAHVAREKLRPIKHSGFVRVRKCGAKLKSTTAIAAVQAANAPHSYTNKNCNDILVPWWVAVVFGCMRGARREALTLVLTSFVQADQQARDALVATYRVGGVEAASLLTKSGGFLTGRVS